MVSIIIQDFADLLVLELRRGALIDELIAQVAQLLQEHQLVLELRQIRLGSGTFRRRGSMPADCNRLDVLWREIAIDLLGLVVEGCRRGLRLVGRN